jgi:hypothetical protein
VSGSGYSDYYLDANRAWEARTYSSDTACYDHIATFGTLDGGRTWRRSEPIALDLKTGWGASPQLFFVDQSDGGLWVRTGATGQVSVPSWKVHCIGQKTAGFTGV